MELLNNKEKIVSFLGAIESNVKLDNIAGYYNINILLEDVVANLLNIIFDYKFINANRIEKNYPAIDLIDEERRIAVQVTSDNGYGKINDTFIKFKNSKKDLPKKIDNVKFFMLKGKMPNYSSGKINKTSKRFNIKKDIMDFSDIVRELDNLQHNKISEIEKYLETIYINKPVIRLDSIKKIERNDDKLEKYINRFIINRESSEHNKEKLIDVIEEKNKVILLSDAGKGKTIEIKKLVKDIEDKDKNLFPFYCKLNTYVNEDIKELIPVQYKDIYKENLVFILDALDEIEEKNRNTFVRKLERFCQENENIKVIITCRNNFYMNKSENFDGTLKNFNEYILCDIERKNINELLKINNINENEFWNEIELKKLDFIVLNIFYLNEIIDIYCKEKKLPTKEGLMDYILDKRYNTDKNKYRNTIDFDSKKNKMENALKKVALTLEMLGKNYLTEQEYNELVSQDDNRELLKYSSLLRKSGNGNYSFIHNNFGEYLAAKKISEYDLDTIKEIVTYENLKTKIKPSWVNTLSFAVNKYKDTALINWIISCMPEFIVYIEIDVISIENRKMILRALLEKYNSKRVWFPYSIRTNNLISDIDDLKYIINIIRQKEHYTTVGNALYILESIGNLFGMDKEIKKELLNVAKKSGYTSYNKAVAINLLANFNLGTYDDLIKIIDSNKDMENSTLRRSYFYYCNTLKIINESIDIFIDRWDSSRNMLRKTDDGDDIYSWGEIQEVHKAFNNITNQATLNKAIDFFETIQLHIHNEEDKLVISLCNSIYNTHKETKEIINNLIRVYTKVEEQYDYANMNAIIKIIKSHNMLLSFFKQYMKLDHKHGYRVYEIIIDDECMEYFYTQYKNYKYKDETTESILIFCSDKIKYYEELKVLYEKRTKKKLEKRNAVDYNAIRVESEKVFIETLFNRDSFIELVSKFINEYGEDGKLYLRTLKDIRRYDKIELNIEYKELLYFICSHFNEADYIDIKSFDSWDWNLVILDQMYQRMNNKHEIELNTEQIKIIEEICKKGIKKCDFRNAQKKNMINRKCLYYWFFRNKYNFEYPEKVLLDMLEFEFSTGGERVGFGYITKCVEKRKIDKRVEENLNSRELPWQVFENHIEYSLENNISNCIESVGRYLENKKNFENERNLAAKYLIKYMKLDKFIKKYFVNLEIKMQRNVIGLIFEKDPEILNDWLIERLNKTNKNENKMFYAQYLILANKNEGYEYYIKYLKKNNRPYKDRRYYEGINEKLGKISNIIMIEWLIEIIQITISPQFKDDTFDGIYNNVRKSIINTGAQSSNSFYIVNNRLSEIFRENQDNKNIGMISYIIEDLENEYCKNYLKSYTIGDIKKKLYELDVKKDAIDSYL